MLWFFGIVGCASAVVAAYNRIQRNDPANAEVLVQTLRQVTGVVIVVARAVASALEALTQPHMRPSYGGARYWTFEDD